MLEAFEDKRVARLERIVRDLIRVVNAVEIEAIVDDMGWHDLAELYYDACAEVGVNPQVPHKPVMEDFGNEISTSSDPDC